MFNANIPIITLAYIGALVFVFLILIRCSWRRTKTQDEEGGEIAKGDSAAVPDAAIATNFQLLSVFPNVTFGITGFVVVPLLNVLGFLLGNYVTVCWLKKFMSAVEQHKTPHSYIAAIHGVPELKKITAWVSFFVFTAVTCFEIVYLSRISKSLLGGTDSSYYALVAMLTIAMVLVAVVGHQRGALKADRYLLLIAYFGIHMATGYLAFLLLLKNVDAISVVVIVALLIMIYYRMLRLKDAAEARWRHVIVLLSSAALFGTLFFYKVLSPDWSAMAVKDAVKVFSPDGNGLSLKVFALATLASFCPVIFYNFVDFSFWQKYLAEVRTGETLENLVLRIKKPFWMYVWESPLSWLLPVLMGLYAVNLVSKADAESNPIPGIITLFASHGALGSSIAVLFFASLVAIATSTACGYLVSTSQLFHVDILNPDLEANRSPMPLMLMAVGMIVILVPVDMFMHSTDNIIVSMLTCFAPLCALTPLVIWPLHKGQLNLNEFGKKGVYVAFSLAGVLGIAFGAVAVFKNASPADLLFWASLPISFVSSWMLYLPAVIFGAKK